MCVFQDLDGGIEVRNHLARHTGELGAALANKSEPRKQRLQAIFVPLASAAPSGELALPKAAVQGSVPEPLHFGSLFRVEIRSRKPLFDPHQVGSIGKVGDESLRLGLEPLRVGLLEPVVDLEVLVDRRSPQAEAFLGIAFDIGVLEVSEDFLAPRLVVLEVEERSGFWSFWYGGLGRVPLDRVCGSGRGGGGGVSVWRGRRW
jgi:hypothetical protein